MKETPLPLVVSAMTITHGLPPRDSLALSSVARMASMSLPSHWNTCQPNERNLSPKSSGEHTVSMRPSILQVVVIDDGDQVIEALVSRKHRSLHLALLAFAVAHNG